MSKGLPPRSWKNIPGRESSKDQGPKAKISLLCSGKSERTFTYLSTQSGCPCDSEGERRLPDGSLIIC